MSIDKDIFEILAWFFSIMICISSSIIVVYFSFIKRITKIEVQMKNLINKVDKHNNVIERTYKLEQAVYDLKNEKR